MGILPAGSLRSLVKGQTKQHRECAAGGLECVPLCATECTGVRVGGAACSVGCQSPVAASGAPPARRMQQHLAWGVCQCASVRAPLQVPAAMGKLHLTGVWNYLYAYQRPRKTPGDLSVYSLDL